MFKKNLTIVEKAVATVPQFKKLHDTLARDFNIFGKAKSTYNTPYQNIEIPTATNGVVN